MKRNPEVSGITFHSSCPDQTSPFRTGGTRSQRHRILCVDDEIVGTRTHGELLEEHGYSVALYHDPLTVLECDLSVFSLAVIDFHMPELNGRELFLRMRTPGSEISHRAPYRLCRHSCT
jgi:PleD family two-component response regulator